MSSDPRYARNDRPELVHPWHMRYRLAGVLGGTWKTEGLGAVEGDRGALLAVCLGVCARKSRFLRSLSLGILRGGYSENIQYPFTIPVRRCSVPLGAEVLAFEVFALAILSGRKGN